MQPLLIFSFYLPHKQSMQIIAEQMSQMLQPTPWRGGRCVCAVEFAWRFASADAVLSGNIYVNSLQILKCDKKISIGDKIVYRSKGKVVLKEISGLSKKGRNFIKIDVYGWNTTWQKGVFWYIIIRFKLLRMGVLNEAIVLSERFHNWTVTNLLLFKRHFSILIFWIQAVLFSDIGYVFQNYSQ